MTENLLGTERVGRWRVVACAAIACRRAMLAAAALTALCTVAAAQPYTWSGFYLGSGGNLNAGTATWGFNNWGSWGRGPVPSAYLGTSGGSVDFTAGYNQEVWHSYWGTVVLGVAGDYAWGNSSGKTDCVNGLFDCTTRTSNFFALRGVAGFAPAGNVPVMFYVTGGAAGATFFDQKTISSPLFTPMRVEPINLGVTSQRWGSVVGIGGEYRIFAPQTLSPALNGSVSVYSQLEMANFSSFSVEPRANVNDNVLQILVGVKYTF